MLPILALAVEAADVFYFSGITLKFGMRRVQTGIEHKNVHALAVVLGIVVAVELPHTKAGLIPGVSYNQTHRETSATHTKAPTAWHMIIGSIGSDARSSRRAGAAAARDAPQDAIDA